MNFSRWVFCCLFFFVLFAGFGAFADDDLIIHGMISQGYLQSTDNNYLSYTDNGSSEFTEAIINFQKQMDDKLRLGVQFMSRDLGEEGNHQVKVDWAYGDYRFNDNIGLRLGRVKVPFGLYNKYRDIDMLRTTVLLPATVYMEDYRQFITAFNGGSVYGNIPLHKGDIELELAFGGSDMDADSGIIKDIFARFNAAYEARLTAGLPPALQAAGLGFAHAGDPNRGGSTNNGYSAKILWNTPIEGLKIGGTSTFLDLKMDEQLIYQPLIVPGAPPTVVSPGFVTNVDINYKFKNVDVGSIEYTKNKFTFAGEFMAAHAEQKINTVSAPAVAPASQMSVAQTSQGSYMQLVYRHNNKHEWSLYRGEFFFDKNNKNWMTWQKDTCASFRYHINSNWSIKLEHHWVDGVALVQKNLNPAGLDRKWNLIAVKTTYNF